MIPFLVLLLAPGCSLRTDLPSWISFKDEIRYEQMGDGACGEAYISRNTRNVQPTRTGLSCHGTVNLTHPPGPLRPLTLQKGFSNGPVTDPLRGNRITGRQVVLRSHNASDSWQIVINTSWDKTEEATKDLFPSDRVHAWADPYFVVFVVNRPSASGDDFLPYSYLDNFTMAELQNDPTYCRDALELKLAPGLGEWDPDRMISDIWSNADRGDGLHQFCSATHRHVTAFAITSEQVARIPREWDYTLDPRRPFDFNIRAQGLDAFHFRVQPGPQENFTVVQLSLPTAAGQREGGAP